MRLSSVTGSAWSSTRRLWYIRGDRHTLGEQRQPLTPELGVHARLGGDRPARRDPRHEAADVGPRRGDGDAERTRLPVTRRDREGMEINHLFKLYHGVSVNPPDYLPRASITSPTACPASSTPTTSAS